MEKAIIATALADIFTIMLAVSYSVAVKLKPSLSIWSLCLYFWGSAIIYLMLFIGLVIDRFNFFECELFFIITSIVRMLTAIFLLYTTWTKNEKEVDDENKNKGDS